MSKETLDLIISKKSKEKKPLTISSEKQKDDEENFPEFLDFPWEGGEKNNPTEEEMQKFFTPEIISQRVLFCPQINKDITDDMGMFGYEEGFILIRGLANKGVHCFNDQDWASGKSLKLLGASIPILPHYDFFPRRKFSHVRITQSDYPVIYNFLRNKLGNIKLLEINKDN